MQKKFHNRIYRTKNSINCKNFDDIFFNVALVVVILVSLWFYSYLEGKDYYAMFVEGDFFWTAFSVFAYILGKQILSKHDYNVISIIVLAFCWISCFTVLGIFFAVKFSDVATQHSIEIFIVSIGAFVIAVLCNIIAKIQKII